MSKNERRQSTRSAAKGVVMVEAQGMLPRRVTGILMDVSATGFRMKYQEPVLERGDIVRFRLDSREGEARVMWNRSEGGEVESGLLILG